jgi:predicted DNA-binding transcriptional regulator YafY
LQPDHFENDAYRQIFRSILYALCSSKPLEIQYRDHDGGLIRDTVRPEKIEYSLKEDRFRLLCSTANRNTALGGAINIGDIVDAKEAESFPRTEKNIPANPQSKPRKELKHASLRVKNERGAGERAQMQFANYKIYAGGSEDFMELEIGYPESNEPELLDEILAFGPLIKVNHFDGDLLKKIRERLDTQRKLMSAPQKT